jgi:WD40 repeat protein
MNPRELRQTIEGPAAKGGWDFEPGLVDLLLWDVGAHSSRQPEPGALPLLSHALLETWQHRRGHTLTFAGYADSGGVRGAIAKTAETVFNQELTTDQQPIARAIFLRLTELGEGTQDTRRRASLEELIPRPEDGPAVEAVLDILASARLVTTEEGSAEVAHEALIREWPQLREWLDEDREGLRLHRQLTEAAQEWLSLGRDESTLYRGVRLTQASEWVERFVDELNPLEREFLNASVEAIRREEVKREARRQRELEAAKKLALAESRRAEEQAHSASQLRQRALFLTGALFIAGILAVVAVVFGQRASQNEQNALAQEATAVAEAAQRASIQATAEADARVAFSRELAAAALNNLDLDPERSILLALHGLSVDHTQEVEEVLHQSVQASRVRLALSGHTGEVWRVAFSQNGEQVATVSSDGTARLWDAVSGQELITLSGHTDIVWDVEFDPSGSRIATSSSDGTARVWSTTTGQALFIVSGHPEVYPIAFSPDGTRPATGGSHGVVKVWDAATGHELLMLSGHTDFLADIAFSPDGKRLATGGGDRTARVWDIEASLTTSASSGQELYSLTDFTGPISGVAFDPDGGRLVTSSGDGSVRVWDVATGLLLFTITDNNPSFTRVTFSPDGERLAVGSITGTPVVWNISSTGSEEELTLAGHTGSVWGLAFSPDGRLIATAGEEGIARIWDASSSADRELLVVGEGSHISFVRRVALSMDGTRLATAGFADATAIVWDAESGQGLLSITGHTGPVSDVVFNPVGALLVTTSADGTAKVWDVKTGEELLSLSGHGTGFVGGLPMGAIDADFSPDGSRLATAGVDGTARVWDVKTGKELLTLSSNDDAVTAVKFSSDGKQLATLNWHSGSQDLGTAKVWDASSDRNCLHCPTFPRSVGI